VSVGSIKLHHQRLLGHCLHMENVRDGRRPCHVRNIKWSSHKETEARGFMGVYECVRPLSVMLYYHFSGCHELCYWKQLLPLTQTQQPQVVSQGFKAVQILCPVFNVNWARSTRHRSLIVCDKISLSQTVLLYCVVSSCTFFNMQGQFTVCCS
jgi:hypothetical protein